MSSSFNDKVVVITGGTSGIGRALAQSFLDAGARVAVCGRNEAALQKLAGQYPAENLMVFKADVSVEADCHAFIEKAEACFHRIDILINNAGISMRALFSRLEDVSVLRKIMDINFWGAVYCTQQALPALVKSRGVVVGVSSIAGYRGLPGRTGYSASKFAMQGFLEALRTEHLHTGVHVMWVCPGFTASNIRNTALNETGGTQAETPLEESRLMTADKVAARILNAIARRKRTLVLTSQGKLTVFLNRFMPGLLDRLVYDHFKKEPGSPLK